MRGGRGPDEGSGHEGEPSGDREEAEKALALRLPGRQSASGSAPPCKSPLCYS